MLLTILRSYKVTISLVGISLIVFLMEGEFFEPADAILLLNQGANFAPYTLQNEPWRIITSLFLHGGFLHILVNMLTLLSLGTFLEKRIGSVNFLLVYLLTGITGNLLSLYWNMFMISVGASGAIFGLFGFEIIISIAEAGRNTSQIIRTILTGVVYVILILIIGTLLPFDNAAHVGGLLTGIIYQWVRIRHPKKLVLFFIPVILLFFLIPRFQVIHFNQFQKLISLDKMHSSASYSTDEEAMLGYEKLKNRYDSLYRELTTPMDNAPLTVLEDRLKLQNYTEKKTLELDYKARLIREESYRYLDSIELVQSWQLAPLNHPLALSSEERVKDSAAVRKVHHVNYDRNWQVTSDQTEVRYYRLGYKDSDGKWHGRVEDFFLTGGIQMKGYYTHGLKDGIFRYYSKDSLYTTVGRYDKERRTGKWEFFHENGTLSEVWRFENESYLIDAWNEDGLPLVSDGNGELKEWYSNGVLKSSVSYSDGVPEGMAYGYYGDGRLKYQENYENGRLILGESYDKNSKNTYDESTFLPYPVGGMEKFRDYLRERVGKADIPSGKVQLLFTVSPEGDVFDIRVYESASTRHDSLAISYLKEGPDWIPAKEHGLKSIASQRLITIEFP